MDKMELIEELEKVVVTLKELDYSSLDAFILKAKLYVKKVFGEKSDYLSMIDNLSFHSMVYTLDNDYLNTQNDRDSWKSGISSLKNIITTMKDDLKLSEPVVYSKAINKVASNNVFIVHGHDDEMKVSVGRLLEKLGLNPVILHEQPDKGRNVLDKLVDESDDACFAVVLLSPDDVVIMGDKRATRARQNVVLELGFFIAKLGKNKVTALYRTSEDFELPSDFVGTLYKEYDSGNGWKVELARELKASGVTIDMNKLL